MTRSVTETDSGGPGGIARILSPLTALLMRRTIARDYQQLKEQLESR